MATSNSRRLGQALRALVALPLLLSLTAARFAVTIPPQLAISSSPEVKIGEPFTAKVGDVLLRARVLDMERAKLTAPFHAQIDRFDQQFDADTELDTVLVPEKARENTGLNSNRYFCGSDLRTRSQFAEAMIGNMFSKWEAIVRFCFADVDEDGKLDHMVLAGAKDKEFQKAVEIAPIAYDRVRLAPDRMNSEIRLVFQKLETRTGELHMELQLWRNGERQQLDYFMNGSMRKGYFQPPEQLYARIKADPQKTPYPVQFVDLLGAFVVIDSIDTEKGEARFIVKHAIGPALFKPVSIQIQYIYIYI